MEILSFVALLSLLLLHNGAYVSAYSEDETNQIPIEYLRSGTDDNWGWPGPPGYPNWLRPDITRNVPGVPDWSDLSAAPSEYLATTQSPFHFEVTTVQTWTPPPLSSMAEFPGSKMLRSLSNDEPENNQQISPPIQNDGPENNQQISPPAQNDGPENNQQLLRSLTNEKNSTLAQNVGPENNQQLLRSLTNEKNLTLAQNDGPENNQQTSPPAQNDGQVKNNQQISLPAENDGPENNQQISPPVQNDGPENNQQISPPPQNDGPENNQQISPLPVTRGLLMKSYKCMVKSGEKGICNLSLTRFTYNNFALQCVPFTYSGCGGNENNFATWLECRQMCGTD